MTRQQFTKALARAYAENVFANFRDIQDDATFTFALYDSPRGETYEVSLHGCTCPGARKGYVCKHQTGLAELVGRVDRLIPGWYDQACPDCGHAGRDLLRAAIAYGRPKGWTANAEPIY